MPNVITTCAKCRFRYEYFFDGRNYVPCPRCGYDPIGSLERATTADLLSQLHSSDRTTRNNAAVALGERRAQEATDSLLAMLASEGASVETGVIVALGHLREKRAAENLITLLKTHPERGHIIGALLRIGTDQALDAVLATNPYDFSISTLQALVQFPGDKVAAVLAKLALGDEGNNRPEKTKAAIASLGEV
ncbi:MAG TPA: HEAT repeat domain-containing protein, partial [Terriglobia bacterium]|nr:HEAT repeat domain-containing protein [Terriglobia bacterium]